MNSLHGDSGFRERYIEETVDALLSAEVRDVEFLDHGVMNYVYRVSTSAETLFFKQALERTKGHEHIGEDLAGIHHSRISTERNFIERLASVKSKGVHIPRVLLYDNVHNIIVLSDVGGNHSVNMETSLRKGVFNSASAAYVGGFLANVHVQTLNHVSPIRGSLEDDRQNWKVFLNMRTRGIDASRFPLDVGRKLMEMYEDALENHSYDLLLHTDIAPKNILERDDGGVAILDFELASAVGDPAYDLGFLLGHCFLFGQVHEMPDSASQMIHALHQAYVDEVGDTFPGVESRSVDYAAAIPLYKLAGSVKADYIPGGIESRLVETSRRIMLSEDKSMDRVIKVLRGES